MEKFLDNIFSAIWKIFDSENTFVIILGLLVLIILSSYIVQYTQFNRATKSFINGTYDVKTFRVFEKFKRRSIFPQSAGLHDQCCCMLSAMHLEKGDVVSFFENMNAVKNVTDTFSWRVYLLLAAYLTEQNYHGVAAVHRTRVANQSTEETIVQFLQTHEQTAIHDKAITAKENIKQQQILEILHKLADI